MKTSIFQLLILAAPCLYAQSVANLDFDFQHGTVISDQYASLGVNISVASTDGDGNNNGINTGIVYDSELGGTDGGTINGADTDLERLSGGGGGAGNANGWTTGNFDGFEDFNAGGLLIIQEHPEGVDSTPGGTPDISATDFNPDDSGTGGVITFDLEVSRGYTTISSILADFEGDSTEDFEIALFDADMNEEIFNFTDFGIAVADTGNNSIVALPELALSTGAVLESVEFRFIQSSGSISGVVFSVPEPSSVCLLGLGGLFLFKRRRN